MPVVASLVQRPAPRRVIPTQSKPKHTTNSVAKTSPAKITVSPTEATPLVAVIGVGFVGTGLVDSFSSQYETMGFDISEARLEFLRGEFKTRPNVSFTSNESDLAKATHFLISVPTLLRSDKTIDLSYLQSALQRVEKWARPGCTVVIESSVAVGMTRQLLGPIAQAKGLFAGMSPERIDPGRVEPPMHSIPKVVSGLDDAIPGSLNSVVRLYERVFDNIVPVSKPEVAEMCKLYENCQRMMCIAYANEMADACRGLGIDAFEVSQAAATKPFGYMPYTPSLGVGGHCIPVNPYYLLSNCEFPLLEACAEKMNRRPADMAKRIAGELMGVGKLQRRDSGIDIAKKVLVVGMGFKAGQDHLVNSPGLQLAKELKKLELDVHFADSLVKQAAVPDIPRLDDEDWTTQQLETFDMIVVSFRQWGMDFDVLDQVSGVPVQMWCQ
ncbi:UDP-n-acetyl-D-mannosamine 6-dehydrogenase [Fusarium heterosporum]|uniref:UDP-n-acetyl-D-mannosamine 6-dehydrogenase n=1 Tax=Fusarium heterosporum TaxID=42747 RepID=A0A8H5SWV2_FUSHE|nr:UDP-n-acetyl-D-mannosamine 6-dehydrogenase [Fusarium heterosporum]